MKEKLWYIVYTKPGDEFKTANTIQKKGVECFCPFYLSEGKKRKKIASPLLPRYVFVQVSREEIAMIKNIKSVVNLMFWLDDYVRITEEDILTLRELTQKCQVITAETISINHTLSTTHEWQTVQEAQKYGVDESADCVKVSFPAYGFAVVAKQKEMNVRVINRDFNINHTRTEDIQFSI